jgi:hypothetical protein
MVTRTSCRTVEVANAYGFTEYSNQYSPASSRAERQSAVPQRRAQR